jgi:hypothetical protein
MTATILTLLAYAAATGILNLVLSKRSQVDAWAEKQPRLAAVLKLCRAIGFDPWMAIQSLSLAVKGKLPESAKK